MIKQTVLELAKRYAYPEPFIETNLRLNSLVTVDDVQSVIDCYKSPQTLDFKGMTKIVEKLSDKYGVHRYTFNMFALVCLIPSLEGFYVELGVPEEIFYDTLNDIKYKYDACNQVYGVVGVSAWTWYELILKLNVFQFGRLQFEYNTFFSYDSYEKGGNKLIKGQEVLSVHIPQSGKPLDYESCKDSYRKAKEFFKKHFNDKPIPFICWSWLVNPNNKLFMKENSNILTFASDYDIIDVVEYKDYNAIAPWLFGKSRVDDLSPSDNDTSLQKRAKEYLKNGGKLACAYGVFFA